MNADERRYCIIRVYLRVSAVNHSEVYQCLTQQLPNPSNVNNVPVPGAVIAQALDDFDGERGLVRAMIRKFQHMSKYEVRR